MFEKDEIMYGQFLEKLVHDAKTRLEEREATLNGFIHFLGAKHGMTGNVEFKDWLTGFAVNPVGEKKEIESDG